MPSALVDPILDVLIRLRIIDGLLAARLIAQEFLSAHFFPRTSCLIADMQMPGMTGLELYQRLSISGKRIPTILITAYPDDGVRERARSAGILGYLSKPFEQDDLLACVRSALTCS